MLDFSKIEDAFLFVSSGPPEEHSALLNRKTGAIYYQSEYGDSDEDIPEDFDDSPDYISIPHKNDLELGRELVFRFASEHLRDDYGTVEDIFRSRGAYKRFKELLGRKGLSRQWYDYEHNAAVNALKEWCRENGLELGG